MKEKLAHVPFSPNHPISSKAGYFLEGGARIKREDGTYTPNGNRICLEWVYRDGNEKFIDYDSCRHDLFKRHNIKISK